MSEKAARPLSDKMVDGHRSPRTWTRNRRSWSALFKEESELEVWKQDRDGRFALLKTYPICRWSGELGPKIKEGDRQAPEGFYTITPGQMNPNSQSTCRSISAIRTPSTAPTAAPARSSWCMATARRAAATR